MLLRVCSPTAQRPLWGTQEGATSPFLSCWNTQHLLFYDSTLLQRAIVQLPELPFIKFSKQGSKKYSVLFRTCTHFLGLLSPSPTGHTEMYSLVLKSRSPISRFPKGWFLLSPWLVGRLLFVSSHHLPSVNVSVSKFPLFIGSQVILD